MTRPQVPPGSVRQAVGYYGREEGQQHLQLLGILDILYLGRMHHEHGGDVEGYGDHVQHD